MFTLIKNVEAYAPKPLGKCDILLCCDKIAKIDNSIPIPFEGIKIIDGEGKLAVPGFIDGHVHVTGGGGESGERSRAPEILMSEITRSGVTTVLGVLGTDSTTRSVQNLVAKTRALNSEGITAYCLTGAYEYPSPTITGSVKEDIAFISEVVGVKIAIADHRSSYITAEELSRLVAETRLAALVSGKVGVVHMHCGNGKKGLSDVFKILEDGDAPIRQFRPTHCGNILEDALKFGRMGGIVDFTSGRDAKKLARELVEVMKTVPMQQITISSDSNGSMPRWNEKRELVGMDVAGIDSLFEAVRCLICDFDMPIEIAISLITENVARALDIYPRKGILAEGSDGDLVLLDGDLKIDTVFARGKIMVSGGETVVKGYYGK